MPHILCKKNELYRQWNTWKYKMKELVPKGIAIPLSEKDFKRFFIVGSYYRLLLDAKLLDDL